MSEGAILAGESFDRAHEAVTAITNELSRAAERGRLGVASADLALFFGHVSTFSQCAHHRALAEQCLDMALESAGGSPSAGLHGGLLSVAWTAQHLQNLGVLSPAEDVGESVDPMLAEVLSERPWRGHFDLISGLAGYAVYAFERAPRAAATLLLERIVDNLREVARRTERGFTFHSPPSWLSPRQRAAQPDGHHDLGVAHGAPGVAVVLAEACARGIGGTDTRDVLNGTVRSIESCRASRTDGRLPYLAEQPERAARTSWCYGDPGAAIALLRVARRTGDEDLRRAAVSAARRSAEVSVEASEVTDCGLCHGAAGLGHQFHRLFAATGDELFREASRRWFTLTLASRDPVDGSAGFVAHRRADDRRSHDVSFLEGTAGIGLALLSAMGGIRPDWDRKLLIALEP